MLMTIVSRDDALATAVELCEHARWEEAEALLRRVAGRQSNDLDRVELELAVVAAQNDRDWTRGVREPQRKQAELDRIEDLVGDRSPRLLAKTMFERGMALHLEFIFAVGDPDRELASFTTAAEIYASVGDREGSALATAFIGIFHHVDRLDRQAALPILQRAYDLTEAHSGSAARSEAARHLGQIRQELGDPAGGIALLEEALELRAEAGDFRHLSSALHALGSAHLEAGDLDVAADYLFRARNLGELHGSQLFLTMIARTEADLAFRRVTGANVRGRTHP
jgi:tetratricopeptide (TPR) repeat protein